MTRQSNKPPKAVNEPHHLLSLPAELREKIWKLVLGLQGKTIHLYRYQSGEEKKKCGQGAAQRAGPSAWLESDSVGTRYHLKPSCCRKGAEWADAYRLSRLAEDFSVQARDRKGRLKQDAECVLSTYNARHRHCRQPDARCEEVGGHTSQCRCSREMLHVDCICSQEDKPDLSLLRVCRAIYFEAAHLPYKDNTFSFPNEGNLSFFAHHVLTPWQRSIIQSVEVVMDLPVARPCRPSSSPTETQVAIDGSNHVLTRRYQTQREDQTEISIDDRSLTDGIESGLSFFPALQTLRLSIPYVKNTSLPRMSIPKKGQSRPLSLPLIKRVEVIAGADAEMCSESESSTREERRELAKCVESFLQGSCGGHAFDRSVAWWQLLVSNGRVIPYPNCK